LARNLKFTGHEKARFLLQFFKNARDENDEILAAGGGVGDGLSCAGTGVD
jgi:hypothetical protein